MIPADDRTPQELVGKRVAFKSGEEHAGCWHCRAGLAGGVVLRPAQTLAQKAEWIRGEGGEVPGDWVSEYEDVPKVWVRADPVEGLRHGCEVAVEVACLLIEGEPGA
jgi:hypothetical protein